MSHIWHKLSPTGAALARAVNIADLRHLARKRAPRPVFDYIDGGADDEVTLRANRRSWDAILFRPRNAVHVPQPDLRVSVLGWPRMSEAVTSGNVAIVLIYSDTCGRQ
jgi:isopentenyl diphosphate isomerase/L-lactate dehydrogenase-like FMN-dependent dehydrogenase